MRLLIYQKHEAGSKTTLQLTTEVLQEDPDGEDHHP